MKIRDGKVWDIVREKWLVMTPEEWVRQHTIEWLTNTLGIEAHRIGREVSLRTGQRADLVVYDRTASAVMIIECKAQNITITQEVFEQIANYNITLGKVEYLVVTNGKQTYCCQFDHDTNSYKFINQLPQL